MGNIGVVEDVDGGWKEVKAIGLDAVVYVFLFCLII